MKKQILISAIALTTIAVNAQEVKKTNDKTGLYTQDKNGGTNVNFGVGTSHPNYRLEVFGTSKFHSNGSFDSTLNVGSIKLLGLSNEIQNAAWQSPVKRIMLANQDGFLTPMVMGTANQVILGDGTLGNFPNFGQWHASGSNLYWNTGNVSIGSVPNNSFKLNVEGDARISHDLFVNNNMYVGGGIVISDKIQGVTEVKGWDFKVENDLQVTGAARFNSTAQLDQGLTFNGSKGIKFIPGQDNGGTFRYGNNNEIFLPQGVPCAAAPYSPVNHQFGGWLQIYDYNNPSTSGMLNLQTWTGGSSIDASVGSQTGGGGLLLNYFCGNNTYINTGANGGEVFMGKTHIGGITSPTAPHVNALLSVGGDVVAKAVYVTQKDWADFVFEPSYKLMPFNELQKYFQENKHLPNVPSTKEITENGNDLANTDRILLQKIEESYLYMAEMEKQIEELKQKNNKLEKELEELKK